MVTQGSRQQVKEKSPDLVGKIKIHRRLITGLLNAIDEVEEDTVICNIAAWQYRDKNGPVLTVQVSEPFQRRQAAAQPNIFDQRNWAFERSKMMSETLTPKSPRWDEFGAALYDAIDISGCDGDEAKPGLVYRHAKEIMANMGDVDVEASLKFFKANGGYCDCEILLNVVLGTR
jgi:hypothetical protein